MATGVGGIDDKKYNAVIVGGGIIGALFIYISDHAIVSSCGQTFILPSRLLDGPIHDCGTGYGKHYQMALA